MSNSASTGPEWPTITEWVVNGEPFRDLCLAEEFADSLEQDGIPITLEIREVTP